MKKAYIHTFGCQMNEYDSSMMLASLETIGYGKAESLEEADCIIVNTCSVRDKADQKVYSLLGRLKKYKRKKGAIIALAGCLAQQIGYSVFTRVPYLDILIGTHKLDKLPDLIKLVEGGENRLVELDMCDTRPPIMRDQFLEEGKIKAFVTIMQGCDNFCTYCIVPLVRGREFSRPQEEIIREIKILASRGIKEITLLGQNVNSYGKGRGESTFPKLLSQVSAIEGIERIRFVTSHPKDFSDKLIETLARGNKVCPHVHLPAQSGSDSILNRMGRGYSRGHYLSLIENLKESVPQVSISSDFIVGFPGEREGDFQDTLSLIEEVEFDNSFSFMFSPRPGTPAASMDGQVTLRVRRERLKELQDLQKKITSGNYRKYLGGVWEVLVEGKSKTDDNKVTGRTRSNVVVNFTSENAERGRIVPVFIEESFANSLSGKENNGGSS